MSVTTIDLVLRLVAASGIGSLIGLNRDLHGKPTGIRTMGLVGLTACLLTVTELADVDGGARGTVFGIITGFGFLGAGVIIKDNTTTRIHGLTTAAIILLVAALGIACGKGAWSLVAPTAGITWVLLVIGGPFESWLRSRAKQDTDHDAPP